MKKSMKSILFFFAVLSLSTSALAKQHPYRLVLITGKQIGNPDLVKLVRKVAKTAGENGLNGLVLDGWFDTITEREPYSYKYLKQIVQACEDNGLEFIPALMGMGYNAPMLTNNKHLIEGLPVRNSLFVVKDGEANVVDDLPVKLVDGGFEEAGDGGPAHYRVMDDPDCKVSVDASVAKEGNSSLKVEISKEFPEVTAVATQEIAVQPYRVYRISCWVKTQGVESRGDVFPLLIQGPDGRRLQYYIPPVDETADWTEAVIAFNSKSYSKVQISVGAPFCDKGTFWVDGITIREEGLVNVLRRGGTPLVVKSEKNGTVYQEGVDYAPVYDPVMTMLFDHEPPPINIISSGRISEGERLRVSYYNNHPIYHGQTPACFSEPEMDEWWRKSVEFLHKYIHPKTYYLGTDELRLAGTCETCKKRGMSMVEMLGDCLKRQKNIIRSFEPEAEMLVWSDMFDPHHNANDRQGDHYYLSDENFVDSWKYIPKDMIIVCWYYSRRDLSLKHFSENGFRTVGSSAGGLEQARGWLESLDKTPGATGIMYTTWGANYDLLADFGKLVSGKK
ncbi:carbohydrate binding domain-containing protein [Gemmatimonadota bacterium]